jgi:hypothetical protein
MTTRYRSPGDLLQGICRRSSYIQGVLFHE